MSTSPEYSRPTIEPVEDNTIITFFPLDDLPGERRREEECHTPTGDEYRLVSVPDTCPPAPRKKSVPASRKKGVKEAELLTVKFDEVQGWFRFRDQEAEEPPLPKVKKDGI